MSEQVASRVRAAIAAGGPIGFDDYMRIALYGPGGFFEGVPVGAAGHFVTAPHVHPYVFAHCVRDALLETWHALDEPDPFRVVELGAGDGSLAHALLEAFAELPEPRVDYVGIEISPGARDALAARGLASARRIEDLEPFEGAVVGNELLDNLPFVPVRGRPGGTVEIRVGMGEDGGLIEVEVPWARRGPRPPDLSEGEESTVPEGAFEMLEGILARLRRGSVLLIDYGRTGGPAGAVHGYREHREIGDVLSSPGDTDITAGVDWSLVADHAKAIGLRTYGPLTQAAALDALGHTRWERTMAELQSRLQRSGRRSEAVRVWEARSRASVLADPSGLGGFWWLIATTGGVRAPRWMARSSSPPGSGPSPRLPGPGGAGRSASARGPV